VGVVERPEVAAANLDSLTLDRRAADRPLRDGAVPAGVYVAAPNSNAIAVFDRDPASGALAQKPGTAACTSETGNGGACRDGTALVDAEDAAPSPDGRNV
jgi:hypothetical protein